MRKASLPRANKTHAPFGRKMYSEGVTKNSIAETTETEIEWNPISSANVTDVRGRSCYINVPFLPKARTVLLYFHFNLMAL